jgi:arylsulfatase
VHEGGACTPLIAHWPNGIAARGELRRSPGHVIDLVPTILELAGARRDEAGGPALPGRSLLTTFKADSNPDRKLWWAHDGHRAMRIGDWKVVAAKGEEWELFNLAEDRTESNNLAATNPEKVGQLVKQWKTVVEEFSALDRTPRGQAKKAGGKKSGR